MSLKQLGITPFCPQQLTTPPYREENPQKKRKIETWAELFFSSCDVVHYTATFLELRDIFNFRLLNKETNALLDVPAFWSMLFDAYKIQLNPNYEKDEFSKKDLIKEAATIRRIFSLTLSAEASCWHCKLRRNVYTSSDLRKKTTQKLLKIIQETAGSLNINYGFYEEMEKATNLKKMKSWDFVLNFDTEKVLFQKTSFPDLVQASVEINEIFPDNDEDKLVETLEIEDMGYLFYENENYFPREQDLNYKFISMKYVSYMIAKKGLLKAIKNYNKEGKDIAIGLYDLAEFLFLFNTIENFKDLFNLYVDYLIEIEESDALKMAFIWPVSIACEYQNKKLVKMILKKMMEVIPDKDKERFIFKTLNNLDYDLPTLSDAAFDILKQEDLGLFLYRGNRVMCMLINYIGRNGKSNLIPALLSEAKKNVENDKINWSDFLIKRILFDCIVCAKKIDEPIRRHFFGEVCEMIKSFYEKGQRKTSDKIEDELYLLLYKVNEFRIHYDEKREYQEDGKVSDFANQFSDALIAASHILGSSKTDILLSLIDTMVFKEHNHKESNYIPPNHGVVERYATSVFSSLDREDIKPLLINLEKEYLTEKRDDIHTIESINLMFVYSILIPQVEPRVAKRFTKVLLEAIFVHKLFKNGQAVMLFMMKHVTNFSAIIQDAVGISYDQVVDFLSIADEKKLERKVASFIYDYDTGVYKKPKEEILYKEAD